jgi:hypothetical protein
MTHVSPKAKKFNNLIHVLNAIVNWVNKPHPHFISMHFQIHDWE